MSVVRRDIDAHVRDYAVALSMAAVAVVVLATHIDVQDTDAYRFHSDTWSSWLLTLMICATLTGRRRWPMRTLAIGLLLMLPLELGRHRDIVAVFALLIVLYSVAGYLPLATAWRGLAVFAAVQVVLFLAGTNMVPTAPLIGPVFVISAFVVGRVLHLSRARQDRLVESAIARATVAGETAELQMADDRLQMAQELHDVVAHSLSVIAVQAGIGVHLVDREPAAAARALDAIRTTTRGTAGELIRLIETLRNGTSSPNTAAPTLDHVKELVEQMGTAGVPVTLTVEGDLTSLSDGVSLAAYRIVQEALTNIVRHAGHAEATVTIRFDEEHVALRIDDNGHGAFPTVHPERTIGGHGLIGMGERARMYGGTVRSGPRPGGGFRVDATLRFDGHSVLPNEVTAPATSVRTTPDEPVLRRARDPRTWDSAFALVLAGAVAAQIIRTGPPAPLWSWFLKIASCLTIAFRRRHPTSSFVVVWTLCLALTLGGQRIGFLIFVLCIGIYTAASNARTRVLAAIVLATYAEVAIIASVDNPEITASGAVWISILLSATAVAGFVVRTDREHRVTDLAQRERTAEAQSLRARLIVTTERLRMADELSAITAHSIATIGQQASAPNIDLDPGAARLALESISATSRDALNDLRWLLKRIRAQDQTLAYAPITPTASTSPTGSTASTVNADALSIGASR